MELYNDSHPVSHKIMFIATLANRHLMGWQGSIAMFALAARSCGAAHDDYDGRSLLTIQCIPRTLNYSNNHFAVTVLM